MSMNITNMEIVRDFLADLFVGAFDLDVPTNETLVSKGDRFIAAIADGSATPGDFTCGAAGCVGGWIPTALPALGIKYLKNGKFRMPGHQDYANYYTSYHDVIKVAFDCSGDVARFIGHPDAYGYAYPSTKDNVVKRLDDLIRWAKEHPYQDQPCYEDLHAIRRAEVAALEASE